MNSVTMTTHLEFAARLLRAGDYAGCYARLRQAASVAAKTKNAAAAKHILRAMNMIRSRATA